MPLYGCPSEITLLFVWMLCRVLLQRSVRPWIFVTKVTHSLMQTHKRPHTHDAIMQMTFLISFWGGNQVHALVEFSANSRILVKWLKSFSVKLSCFLTNCSKKRDAWCNYANDILISFLGGNQVHTLIEFTTNSWIFGKMTKELLC